MNVLTKKQFISLIIGIAFMLVLVFGAAYAWFGNRFDNSAITTGSVRSVTSASLSVVTGEDINFVIDSSLYSSLEIGQNTTTSSNLQVQFEKAVDSLVECSYDVDVVYSGDVPYSRTTELDGNFELSLKVLNGNNIVFSETNFDELSWRSDGQKFRANLLSDSIGFGTKDYTFVLAFYKLGESQYVLSGMSFPIAFEVSNVICE